MHGSIDWWLEKICMGYIDGIKSDGTLWIYNGEMVVMENYDKMLELGIKLFITSSNRF